MPQSRDALDDQLNAYAGCRADARSTTAAHLRNWSIYAGATASALAMSTSAHASIVYVNLNNLTATLSHGTWGNALVPGLGHVVLQVSRYNNPPSTFAFAGLEGRHSTYMVGHDIGKPGTEGGFVSNFALNAPITNGMRFVHGGGFIHTTDVDVVGRSRGNFPDGVSGFVALRLPSGDLGWIRVEWDDSISGHGRADHVIGIDYAYNTVPGQTILAGEGIPPAIPEPGTMSLALLAAGAIGIAAWKRRRKAA
jgi:hypothetical protein